MRAGGVLYAGPSRVAFVPHSVNLPQHRETVEIPGESLRVEVRVVQPGVMQRFLAPGRSFERLVLRPERPLHAGPRALESVPRIRMAAVSAVRLAAVAGTHVAGAECPGDRRRQLLHP